MFTKLESQSLQVEAVEKKLSNDVRYNTASILIFQDKFF